MKDAFKVKKGLNVQPTDPAEVVNPEAGDIIVDSTDDNRLKVYDPTSSEFAAVGTGGSSGNILSDIEKLTPTVSNVVAVTDTTTFLPIDDKLTITRQCSVCLCFVNAKCKFRQEHCPLDKWQAWEPK